VTCDEYLALLSNTPLGEAPQPPALDHASHCRECQRVAQVIVERERRLLSAYRQLDSVRPALLMAETAAVTASRRRSVASFYRFATVAVLLALLAAVTFEIVVPRIRSAARERTLVTETFTMRCLTPTQAGSLIQPYVRSNGSAYYTPDARDVLIVRATEEELMKTRATLDRFDNPAAGVCAVPKRSPTASP